MVKPMDRHSKYPAISDLRARARCRLPHFVWEYLDSATGDESVQTRNRAALDRILLMPSILHGEQRPDLSVTLLGQKYPLPFGIAPVGMSGLFWPNAEHILAREGARAGIPYSMSTVASKTPEDVATDLGPHAWYQFYPARDPEIRADMLTRARKAGFGTLVLTVDVPVASRRERQVKSGLTSPPRITPRILAQVMMRPAWAMGMARAGMPRMRMIDSYATRATGLSSTEHMGYLIRTSPDWDYLRWIRDFWDGPLIVKGVLNPDDVPILQAEGVDAIWVSNHGGRQFAGAPASIDMLPLIRAKTDLPIIFDSGIDGGLDILRAFAMGANFVMMGRAWHYALAALGPIGAQHMTEILTADLISNMGQLGLRKLTEAHRRRIK